MTFRRLLIALAVALAATLALGSSMAPARPVEEHAISVSSFETMKSSLLDAINDWRRARGLHTLRRARGLAQAAGSHAYSMGDRGYFGHESVDGSDFSERILKKYWVKGYRSWSLGENILWASYEPTPEEALKVWLESPLHRRILREPRWREVGLGAVRAAGAPGVFGGNDVVVIVADFGVRY